MAGTRARSAVGPGSSCSTLWPVVLLAVGLVSQDIIYLVHNMGSHLWKDLGVEENLVVKQASLKGFSKFQSRFLSDNVSSGFWCDRYLNIHLISFSLRGNATAASLPSERTTEVLLNVMHTILLSCRGMRAGGRTEQALVKSNRELLRWVQVTREYIPTCPGIVSLAFPPTATTLLLLGAATTTTNGGDTL